MIYLGVKKCEFSFKIIAIDSIYLYFITTYH